MMEPLFKVSASDESFLLHMKNKLMSGTESLQVSDIFTSYICAYVFYVSVVRIYVAVL